MQKIINSEAEMMAMGEILGSFLLGGEVIELVGDVGVGKTTLVKGIARGLKIEDVVQSPSFTISRLYKGRDNLNLAHYDFYRLNDAGIMENEIEESTKDDMSIVIIEWGDPVSSILPTDKLTINIAATKESQRSVNLKAGGPRSQSLIGKMS